MHRCEIPPDDTDAEVPYYLVLQPANCPLGACPALAFHTFQLTGVWNETRHLCGPSAAYSTLVSTNQQQKPQGAQALHVNTTDHNSWPQPHDIMAQEALQ